MTPITPQQFETILNKAQYDGRTHAIDMVVEVPAGVRAAQPEAHLVAWNNHTAESIRLEIIGGWPVVGVQVREKGSETALYGFGVANRQGSRFAQPSQVCPRCGRTFLLFEVIAKDGDCADRDQCVKEAGDYKAPLQPPADWMVQAGYRKPYDREKEERLGQFRNARNLRREIARRNAQPQPDLMR